MRNIVIFLDPAHGSNVKGKCSPDNSHKEYLWSRERVKHLKEVLEVMGYEVFVTNDTDQEIGLTKRKNFATNTCKNRHKLLLSLHNNAAGNEGKWMNARGVEVFTTIGYTKADVCADYILRQFERDFPELKFRYNRNALFDRDKEANFTVLSGSDYMGVLVEWLFQDNKEDVAMLKDPVINERFECSIVSAIETIDNYFKG